MFRHNLRSTRLYSSGHGIFEPNLSVLPKKKLNSALPTHELLQKLNYVKQPSAGLVHWLPLGIKTIDKINRVIRERMDEVGFTEVALSSLSPAQLWQKTGRWNNAELFKLKGNSGEVCLVATCEEEVTELVNKSTQSYKQLPVKLYQITRKYRDEKRPRFGLLRGREFLMKDGYSFDIDTKSAIKTYNSVNGAYKKIFEDLKVPYLSASADSGEIGGNTSLEWHFVHETGEDTLMKCNECGDVSNVEKTLSYPTKETPSAKVAKVKYFTTLDNSTFIAAYYPEDRQLLPGLIKQEIEDIDLANGKLTNEEVVERFLNSDEEDSEIAVKQIIRVIDPRVTSETDLPDFPSNVKFQRNNFTSFTDLSIVEAKSGEICGECHRGTLEASRAIEIGHTFYLGKRYSTPMEAGVVDKDQQFQLFEMGCYGIGVSRLLAAMAEILKDEKGLVWPAKVAPYEVTLIYNEDKEIEKIKEDLKEYRIDYRIDNNATQFIPDRIRTSAAIGIPLTLIIGGKAAPKIEIEVRSRKLSSEKSFESKFEELKDTYGWEWFVDKKGNEKHLVDPENVVKVVKILLKDL